MKRLAGVVAELEIGQGAPAPPPVAAFSADGFQPLTDFYARLRANGNQYGPQFQLLSCVQTRNGESLARLRTAENRLLDAAVQLLAPFVMDQGKTFVLRSIERIEVYDLDLPETLWGHATQRGDVRLFDDSGKTYLELFGVAFSLLERSRGNQARDRRQLHRRAAGGCAGVLGRAHLACAWSPNSRPTTRCSSSCWTAPAPCAGTPAASTRSCCRLRTGARAAGTRSPTSTRSARSAASAAARGACCPTGWRSPTSTPTRPTTCTTRSSRSSAT